MSILFENFTPFPNSKIKFSFNKLLLSTNNISPILDYQFVTTSVIPIIYITNPTRDEKI